MTNEIVLNGKAIALMSVGINNQLNTKQQALLKLLHECLKKNEPLNWDLMIDFYIKNVDNYHSHYVWNGFNDYTVTKILIDKNKINDTYGLKPRIRNWFATNMGSMILKGSILALPVIEIN